MQAPGARVEVWFQDEARIGQKNSLTRVWGQPAAGRWRQKISASPRPICLVRSARRRAKPALAKAGAAALIMPICNPAAMNHHLCEIGSQVAADAHAVVILDGAS